MPIGRWGRDKPGVGGRAPYSHRCQRGCGAGAPGSGSGRRSSGWTGRRPAPPCRSGRALPAGCRAQRTGRQRSPKSLLQRHGAASGGSLRHGEGETGHPGAPRWGVMGPGGLGIWQHPGGCTTRFHQSFAALPTSLGGGMQTPPRRSGLAHGAQDLLLSRGDRDALPPQGPCATGTLTASPSLILHPGKLRQGRSGHGAEPLSIHTGSPDWCSRGLGDPSVPTSTTGTTTQHGLSSVRCRPRTAETILYMESSKRCLLHSRRDARVIFGNAESPTTNAGAGLVAFLITARWAPCGTAAVHPHPHPCPRSHPIWPCPAGSQGPGRGQGQDPAGRLGRGATFAEASAGNRRPGHASALTSGRVTKASPAHREVAAASRRLRPTGTSLRALPRFPAPPPRGHPTAGTPRHGPARHGPAPSSQPCPARAAPGGPPGRRGRRGALRCPHTSPLPVKRCREVWKARSSQAPVTHAGPWGRPGCGCASPCAWHPARLRPPAAGCRPLVMHSALRVCGAPCTGAVAQSSCKHEAPCA